jgi:hypothetical protein
MEAKIALQEMVKTAISSGLQLRTNTKLLHVSGYSVCKGTMRKTHDAPAALASQMDCRIRVWLATKSRAR